MMMIETDEPQINIILHDADFPANFKNKDHPNDYIPVLNPTVELIYHKRRFHSRLLARIPIKIDETTYIPITFVCDTGAPDFIFLSEKAKSVFSRRILVDELDNSYMKIGDKKYTVNDTPSNHNNHDNVNILGLRILMKFGIYLFDNDIDEGFSFTNLPSFF